MDFDVVSLLSIFSFFFSFFFSEKQTQTHTHKHKGVISTWFPSPLCVYLFLKKENQ